jgi:hypothetical protein
LINRIYISGEHVQNTVEDLATRTGGNCVDTRRPEGVVSKNDNGACIKELSIYIDVSEQQNHKKIKELTESCRFFELLKEQSSSNTVDEIALNKIEANEKIPYTARYREIPEFSPDSLLFSLHARSAKLPNTENT